jgi:AcrR family transcriptional regulator
MSESIPPKTAAELFGAPEVPKQGRERLVVIAVELFYRNGFNAVGVDRVTSEAGVSKTTFYKHFDSLTDLMVAAVRWRDQWESKAWDRAVRARAGEDPRRRLRGHFEVMDEWFQDPDFIGCMFINAASEFPDPAEPVHQAAADHKRRSRDAVRDLGQEGGAADPEAFADAYTLLHEGTLVMRQVMGQKRAAELALPLVDELLARHLPG